MAEFKTPLPRLLAQALSQALNALVRADTSPKAQQRLAKLDQQSVALSLTGLQMVLIFTGFDAGLTVKAVPPGDFETESVDTTITGTPDALLAMAVPDWATSDSGVRIEGNAQAAQALEQLMRQLDPDWEGLLVARFGQVIGHQLYRALANALTTSTQLSRVGRDQVTRYVNEEAQWAVNENEFQAFGDKVYQLQEAIDRLEVTLQRRGFQ